MKPQSVIDRFYENVQAGSENECWPWTGCTSGGYGVFKSYDRKNLHAHRYAYGIEYGFIPAGMVVRHTCDNPACCNPKHLILGTHTDNVADRVARGRSAKGERNGRAKLTRQQVEVIRQRVASGERSADLGREYGVHQSTIRLAVIGHNWK